MKRDKQKTLIQLTQELADKLVEDDQAKFIPYGFTNDAMLLTHSGITYYKGRDQTHYDMIGKFDRGRT